MSISGKCSNVVCSICVQWLGELVLSQSHLLVIYILLAMEKPSYPLVISINYPVALLFLV